MPALSQEPRRFRVRQQRHEMHTRATIAVGFGFREVLVLVRGPAFRCVLVCTRKAFTKGRSIFSRSTENGPAFPESSRVQPRSQEKCQAFCFWLHGDVEEQEALQRWAARPLWTRPFPPRSSMEGLPRGSCGCADPLVLGPGVAVHRKVKRRLTAL